MTGGDRVSGGTPAALRLALTIALPTIGALTVAGTYFGKEVIVVAAWIAFSLAGFLFVRPAIGIMAMTAAFLLAAYPTLLQALGFLTINNLLGVCFVILAAAHILETRDLSMLRNRQIQILVLIGLLMFIGTLHADALFPMLQKTRGRGKVIDTTEFMAHNFVARLAYLTFFLMFVRTRADIKLVMLTFMIALFIAIPSALWNLATGTLNRGFRTAASFTSGSNPNRLAMICLIEVACWWFWLHARPGMPRRITGLGAIAASVVALLGTGSRSGMLGLGMLLLLLQTSPKQFRVSAGQMGLFVAVGALAVATVVTPESWDRMTTLNPEKGEIGESSNRMREATVERAWEIFVDHPVFGIGLGNFREVSRQVYGDLYFRPPHNSYLWAASECGIFVVGAYLALFWVTWRDLRRVRLLAHRDPELGTQAGAIRVVFLLYAFFCGFADLWLNPITYAMLGLVIVMRRYFESLPEIEAAAAPSLEQPAAPSPLVAA